MRLIWCPRKRGRITPPPPFTFQQWNPAASGTFQLQQPGVSPSWAIASALRTHTGAEAWKGLANVGIDLLASTLQFTLKSGGFGFANVDALIPRFRLDPHDDGQVVRDIGHFTLGATMIVGTGGLGGGEAIAGEALDVAGAKAAERLLGAAETATVAPELSAASATNSALLRNQLTADEISNGHAFDKHVLEQGQFPGITTRAQFATEIEGFLNSPDTVLRNLSGGRAGYWNGTTGTVLIRNPAAADGGTFFRPTAGIDYFWGLQ